MNCCNILWLEKDAINLIYRKFTEKSNTKCIKLKMCVEHIMF